MTDEEISSLFAELYADFRGEAWMAGLRPLLAHYTSIQVLEKILADDEIWLSNPLFMNDLEEMRFGLNTGRNIVSARSVANEGSITPERAAVLKAGFFDFFQRYENEHALNVYVFCLSEHDPQDTDGRLSMWRAYGGSGNGAAIVFNTTSLPLVDSPLIMSKIRYETTEGRVEWIRKKAEQLCTIVASSAIPDNKLHIASWHLFTTIQLFALTTKHMGFSEEREWRVIYMPERDPKNILHDRFGYIVGRHGVEPKLKLKIAPIEGITAPSLSVATILDRIILGPSISSPLAKASFLRMLDQLGKGEFTNRVFSSSIPLRPH